MQRRTLIRARDLAAFREALLALASRTPEGAPLEVRRRAVVVPTRAAAELLRQTLEARLGASQPAAVFLPDFVTRHELIERLLQSVPGAPRLLTRAEREILMAQAARATKARRRMPGAPFPLRPNLVAAMLDFYDELRRRQRTVRRLAAALFEQLGSERGTDRGSEGLIHQTCFLGFSFLAYERAVQASGAMDEHTVRAALLAQPGALPYSHLVIAVADHPSDPRGLWPSDFDLIGRLAALTRIDVVVTDGLHDSRLSRTARGRAPGHRGGPMDGGLSEPGAPASVRRARRARRARPTGRARRTRRARRE